MALAPLAASASTGSDQSPSHGNAKKPWLLPMRKHVVGANTSAPETPAFLPGGTKQRVAIVRMSSLPLPAMM